MLSVTYTKCSQQKFSYHCNTSKTYVDSFFAQVSTFLRLNTRSQFLIYHLTIFRYKKCDRILEQFKATNMKRRRNIK